MSIAQIAPDIILELNPAKHRRFVFNKPLVSENYAFRSEVQTQFVLYCNVEYIFTGREDFRYFFMNLSNNRRILFLIRNSAQCAAKLIRSR